MKWFYCLLDKTILRDKAPENWVNILSTYLSEIPRNLGVAIIASGIVLLFVENLNKIRLVLLFAVGVSFIMFSTGFDIKMITRTEYKEIKETYKELLKKIETKK